MSLTRVSPGCTFKLFRESIHASRNAPASTCISRLNQAALAKRLGISKRYLSEIEGGKKIPTLGLLRKVVEVFKMPLSPLLFFDENICDPPRLGYLRSTVAGKALRMLDWVASKEEVK